MLTADESVCSARTPLLADVTVSPVTPLVAPGPRRTTTGVLVYSGAVVPSMTVPPLASPRAGSGLATAIVPATVKAMVSAGSAASLAWALASRMAWRSEPGTASARVLTVTTAGAVRSSRTSGRGRVVRPFRRDGRRRAARFWYRVVIQLRICIRTAPRAGEVHGHEKSS